MERTEIEVRCEALARRIRRARPTWHAFRARGKPLLYVPWRGALFGLGEAAFALLDGIERGADPSGDPGQGFEEALAQVEQLAEQGLFAPEEPESPEEREATLAAHLDHQPNKMMLLVQTSCNLRCSYYYEVQSGFHQRGGGMQRETAIQAVEHLIRRAGSRRELEITFFGGEPLLRFRLIREVVAYCERRGAELGRRFHYPITTNGTLLDEGSIAFLVEHRFGVMVSLDGEPQKADLHRVDLAGRGVGAKALANARRLVEAQRAAGVPTANVRVTMTPENHDAQAIEAFLAEQGFDRTTLGAAVGRAHGKGPSDLRAEDHADLQQGFEELALRWLDHLDARGPRPPGNGVPRSLAHLRETLAEPRRRASIGCGVGRNMQAITAAGRIAPCHRYAGEEPYALGNLRDGLDPARTRRYYEEILDGHDRHCSGCWARFACGGQCPWYLSRPDGQVGLPDEPSCDRIRAGLELQLWLLSEIEARRARRDRLPAPASAETTR